jgi:hypothetical protein
VQPGPYFWSVLLWGWLSRTNPNLFGNSQIYINTLPRIL